MRRRQWITVIAGALLIMVVGTTLALPQLVRWITIVRIQAMTGRDAAIDAVEVQLLRQRVVVHGFRLAERGGDAPFADFERLDLSLRLAPLLRGHIWIREAILTNPVVRVVRFPETFNISDLVGGAGDAERRLGITVERFALAGGTVTLEDRALPEWRTWRSEQIEIEAHDLSTERDDGRARATSVTAGAPISLTLERVRLYPIHLVAAVSATDVDLSLARVYLPPGLPVVPDRGRFSTRATITLDARAGVRADATGEILNLALMRPGDPEPVAVLPTLTARMKDAVFNDGGTELGEITVAGAGTVRQAGPAGRLDISSLSASIADVTWPVIRPGRLDVVTKAASGETLSVTGTLAPPPVASQLRLRLSGLDLKRIERLLPVRARVTGLAEADLRLNEALAVGVPKHVDGSIAITRVGIHDGRQEVLAVRRIEAAGLEVQWPHRVAVKRLLVDGPRGALERNRDGEFPALRLLAAVPGRAETAEDTTDTRPDARTRRSKPGDAVDGERPGMSAPVRIDVAQVLVQNGTLAWRDAAVTPPARIEVSDVDARVAGAGWPLRGPLDMSVSLEAPGGGRLRAEGRVGLEPLTADLRVRSSQWSLAPYQPYARTPARLNGRADIDASVALPAPLGERIIVKGTAAVSQVDVRDGERTVMAAERAAASGLTVEWPERVTVNHLALRKPWILLERDEAAAFPMRALLNAKAARADAVDRTRNATRAPSVSIRRIEVDNGGARLVDRSISPPFAVDFHALAGDVNGLSTDGQKPARMDLTGRVGAGSLLTLQGTVGPFGGPLHVDVRGDVRGFAVPRTNAYLAHYVAWEAVDGFLTTTFRCRIDGDTLNARTDVHLNRLRVVRKDDNDAARARIGLPFGLIVALLKDKNEDIRLSLPVGGRLNDPRFDYGELIWSALRRVAANAIAGPVSAIGRVEYGADSRVARIVVDPIPFEPGTATLTPAGREQATRLARFLSERPDLRVTLTPAVSAAEAAQLGRQAAQAAIGRLARESGAPPEVAAARLFSQNFPGRPVPPVPDDVLSALAQREAAAGSESDLAKHRVDAVRAMVKDAGVEPDRLPTGQRAVTAEPGPGAVTVALVEPIESPQRERPGRLRRLFSRGPGVPTQ
jgi:hypothetical protein